MNKMMLGPISILVACSVIYTAQSAENPAAPAAPTTPAVVAPAAAPAPTTTPAAAPTTTPAAAPTTTPAAAPTAATSNLSGKWSSNLAGDVIIEHTGNKVTGFYQYTDDDDVTQDGKLEGLIEGKTIKANWWERPKVGKGEESRGTLEWKITDDGKTLVSSH